MKKKIQGINPGDNIFLLVNNFGNGTCKAVEELLSARANKVIFATQITTEHLSQKLKFLKKTKSGFALITLT